jgi:hypothetical protein
MNSELREALIAEGRIVPDCDDALHVPAGGPVLRLDDAGRRVARQDSTRWIQEGRREREFDDAPLRLRRRESPR